MLKSKKSAPAGVGNVNEDISGCEPMEGLMKKLNSSNVWKDRYGQLCNSFFMTYKPKSKKPTSEVKESIDLRQTDSIVVQDGQLKITMDNGDILLYKGDNIMNWLRAIQSRLQWIEELDAVNNAKGITDTNRIHIAGVLKKKSHNKYQGYQDRYVKLEGNFLRYYKKESDVKELGFASMETTEFIRPYDNTIDCKVFEIKDEDRVFVFETRTHTEMLKWISIIDEVKSLAQKSIQEEVQAKRSAELPYRIRRFDDEGEEGFRQLVVEELLDFYPLVTPWVEINDDSPKVTRKQRDSSGSNEEDDEEEEEPVEKESPNLTIKQHLSYASDVVGYMKAFIPEVQKTTTHAARYDILAVLMVEINRTLENRLLSFLNPAKLAAANAAANSEQDDDSSGDEDDNDRHPLLENANLGDLHRLIDWIARYQTTLKGILCPIPASHPAYKHIKSCAIFDELTEVCRIYAYGGSKGAKGGAAAHLYDHCNKVWENVMRQPEEMIQKHSNGSFYTHAPIDMWEAINQHISLATSTSCPILHVMIADKVVISLNHVINNIIDYVTSLDTTPRPELKEIELEYISALANDTALHIEEVIELIENFTILEIRERIDEIFDPMTTNLVNCGQCCLRRLAKLVMSDVQSLLDEVFMDEWLEGNQVSVATATIGDYMVDFEEFLVNFWADKFVYTILEEVILSYCRTIVFRKSSAQTPVLVTNQHPSPQVTPTKGFFTSFFQKTKDVASLIVAPSGPMHVEVDDECRGRLAQDINTLNAFFSKKAGQEVATEFLAIINEISLMLFLDVHGIVDHVIKLFNEFPSSAIAIFETAQAIIKLRESDIPRSELQGVYVQQVKPMIDFANQQACDNEDKGVVEGRLGLLYLDLVPREILLASTSSSSSGGVASGTGKVTLAQRLKNMSNIPLLSLGGSNKVVLSSRSNDENEEDDDNDGRDRDSDNRKLSFEGSPGPPKSPKSLAPQKSAKIVINNAGLLDDVMEVLNQQDEADAALIREIEEERLKEEELRQVVGKLSYDGKLEKKSPATNLWQKRYYKLTTRETHNPDKPYLYHLNWYLKEGGSVIKALESDKIASMSITFSPRKLAYSPYKLSLALASEVTNQIGVVDVVCSEKTSTSGSVVVQTEEFCTFTVMQTDNKEHILRSAKVDRVIKWVNTIALAASLGYDERQHMWTRDGLVDMKLRQREISNQMAANAAAFRSNSAAVPPPPKQSHSPTAKQRAGSSETPTIDPLAAIQAAKEEERKVQQQMEADERERQKLIQEEEEEEQRVEEERRLQEEQTAAAEAKAERLMKEREEAVAAEAARQAKKEADKLRKRQEKERLEKEQAAAELKEKQDAEAAAQQERSINPIHAAKKAAPATVVVNPLTATDGRREDAKEEDDEDLGRESFVERESISEGPAGSGSGKSRSSKKGKRKAPPPPPPVSSPIQGVVPAPLAVETLNSKPPSDEPPSPSKGQDSPVQQRDSNESADSANGGAVKQTSLAKNMQKLAAARAAAREGRVPGGDESDSRPPSVRQSDVDSLDYEMNLRATTVTTPLDNMLLPRPAKVHSQTEDNEEVAEADKSKKSNSSSPKRSLSEDSSKKSSSPPAPVATSLNGTTSPPAPSDSPVSSMKGRRSIASSNGGSMSSRTTNRVSFAPEDRDSQDPNNDRMVSIAFGIEDKDSVGLVSGRKKSGCGSCSVQ